MANNSIQVHMAPDDVAILMRGMKAVSMLIAQGTMHDEADHGVISDAAFMLADLSAILEGAIEKMAGKLAQLEVQHA